MNESNQIQSVISTVDQQESCTCDSISPIDTQLNEPILFPHHSLSTKQFLTFSPLDRLEEKQRSISYSSIDDNNSPCRSNNLQLDLQSSIKTSLNKIFSS